LSETEVTVTRRTSPRWIRLKDWTLEEILEKVLEKETDLGLVANLQDEISNLRRNSYAQKLTVARRDEKIRALTAQIEDLQGQVQTLGDGLRAMTAVQAKINSKK
jgi:hypothetical protein